MANLPLSGRYMFSQLPFKHVNLGLPNDVPRLTNEDLPIQSWKRGTWDELSVIPWHNCAKCGATPQSKGQRVFRYCAGCYRMTWRDRPRYCSFECLKEDWKSRHNIECSQFRVEEAQIENEILPMGHKQAEFRRMEIRQAVRWGKVIEASGLLDWATKQALSSSSIKNPQNVVFQIDMASAFRHPQSPVFIQSIAFKFVAGLSEAMHQKYFTQHADLIKETNGKLGYFLLNINGWDCARGLSLLHDPPETDIPFCPPWLWAFSHCTLMGDINPNIARARLDALVRALASLQNAESNPDIVKFMRRFESARVIRQSDSYDLLVNPVGWLDEWMSVMYPIVGRIGGRIRLPCKGVKKRYQHTLDK